MNYSSFGPWNPAQAEFPYDTEELHRDGFKVRARLDKRNPDLRKLVEDLRDEGREVKTIEIGSDSVYVDVWYRGDEH